MWPRPISVGEGILDRLAQVISCILALFKCSRSGFILNIEVASNFHLFTNWHFVSYPSPRDMFLRTKIFCFANLLKYYLFPFIPILKLMFELHSRTNFLFGIQKYKTENALPIPKNWSVLAYIVFAGTGYNDHNSQCFNADMLNMVMYPLKLMSMLSGLFSMNLYQPRKLSLKQVVQWLNQKDL